YLGVNRHRIVNGYQIIDAAAPIPRKTHRPRTRLRLNLIIAANAGQRSNSGIILRPNETFSRRNNSPPRSAIPQPVRLLRTRTEPALAVAVVHRRRPS